jgi:hypothetical protein
MVDMQPQGEVRPHLEVGTGHEASTVNIKGILIFAFVLVVLGGAIQIMLAQIMRRYSIQESRSQALRPPQFNVAVPFPAPRLQSDPAADLARLKEQAFHQLNSYGWVNREVGIAHIPIERAMDILARSGLPAHTGTPKSSSEPTPRSESEPAAPHEAGSKPHPGQRP